MSTSYVSFSGADASGDHGLWVTNGTSEIPTLSGVATSASYTQAGVTLGGSGAAAASPVGITSTAALGSPIDTFDWSQMA